MTVNRVSRAKIPDLLGVELRDDGDEEEEEKEGFLGFLEGVEVEVSFSSSGMTGSIYASRSLENAIAAVTLFFLSLCNIRLYKEGHTKPQA